MRRLLLVAVVLASLVALGRGQVPCDVLEAQPACDVALLPGPTANTLEIVEIDGVPVSTSAGQLRLTTVAIDPNLDLWEWVRQSFSSTVDLVDRDIIYPPDVPTEQVAERNARDMVDSQTLATVAGLLQAGYTRDEIFHGARIVAIADEAAAGTEALAEEDVIDAVDGAAVVSADEVVALVSAHAPGDEVVLTIRRDDVVQDVTLVARENPDDPTRALLGILLDDVLELPVDVSIDAGNIGGPSAGLMFALGIVDLLDPIDLTNGLVVAGTGTIDFDGNVGAIGGIRQKVVGASTPDDETPAATVFLTPRDNLAEARTAAVDRQVLLVPVSTLAEAVQALQDLAAGRDPAGAIALGA